MLDLRSMQEASWRRILIVCVSCAIIDWACVNILSGRIAGIELATYGLVQSTLVFSGLTLLVVVPPMFLPPYQLQTKAVGLRASHVPLGIAITIGAWTLLQLTLAITDLRLGGRTVPIAAAWHSDRWTWEIGSFTSQIFGNALVEELIFRGYLLPQFYLKLGGKKDQITWRPLVGAVVVSQFCDTLAHIPNLHNIAIPGLSPPEQLAQLFIIAVLFAILYIRTANIFVCVGFHTLLNAPMPLIEPMIQPQTVIFVMMLVVLVVWRAPSKSGRSQHV